MKIVITFSYERAETLMVHQVTILLVHYLSHSETCI